MTELSMVLSRESKVGDGYVPQIGRNRVLRLFPPAILSRMAPFLEESIIEKGQTLHQAGQPIADIHFPQSGMVVITNPGPFDKRVSLALVGRENAVGLAAAIGSHLALNSAYGLVTGTGYRMSAARLTDLAREDEDLRDAVVRANDVILAEIQQSVVCNALHDLPSRMCRLLLRARDLLGSDAIPITQTELSTLLGVQRTSVTLVSTTLQSEDILRTFRGRIVVHNVAALEKRACSCHGEIRDSTDRVWLGEQADPGICSISPDGEVQAKM